MEFVICDNGILMIFIKLYYIMYGFYIIFNKKFLKIKNFIYVQFEVMLSVIVI